MLKKTAKVDVTVNVDSNLSATGVPVIDDAEKAALRCENERLRSRIAMLEA